MIATGSIICLSLAAGFGAGSFVEGRLQQAHHNKQIARMAKETEAIINRLSERHRLRVQKLKSQVEGLARACGVELPVGADEPGGEG